MNSMTKKNQKQQEKIVAAEGRIGLSRMVKITNRQKDKLETLISRTIETLEGYNQEFKTAAEERDKKALDTLIHKGTMTIYYIEAQKLDTLMQQTREAVKEKQLSAALLEKKIQETSTEFSSVIKQLKAVDINALLEEH